MAPLYNHKDIEKRWQKYWDDQSLYRTLSADEARLHNKEPLYVLDMFPYPSGAGLHVGHPRGYIASDVFARLKRMQGYNVLHPIGFDSFGLPAEQYAIKTGNHPGPFTDSLIERYKEQLSLLGFSYDWTRQVATHDPEYYRWTQWIFIQLYNAYFDETANKARPISDLITMITDDTCPYVSKADWDAYTTKEQHDFLMQYRLAYEGYSEVNWCPELGTVLAHDEIIEKDGVMVSERGEYPVEKKSMRQWFMRISQYSERLLSGLEDLDWPQNIKEIQKNWIGKSSGAQINFSLNIPHSDNGNDLSLDVFTTRPDTLYGVTYMVIAPEHPIMSTLIEYATNKDDITAYQQLTQQKTDIDRMKDSRDKTGVAIEGIFAIHPLTNKEIPVWVGDYVLAHYGTGAIMAVPAHDKRDHDFATTYGLPIIPVIAPADDNTDEIITGVGTLINSESFNGRASDDIFKDITKQAGGTLVTRYKMRDAIFARQRYWGEPIPLIHNNDGTISEVPDDMLPLSLPNLSSFEPTGDGTSPLSRDDAWQSAGYETNTMPGWAGSSWYFLRYIDPKNTEAFASSSELEYWFGQAGGVDMYVGGQEHATGHLLYARFWHMVLHDLGFIDAPEPFKALRNQGMIGGADGRKMSKRYGNVINPDDVVDHVGADTLRVFEMFLGPFDSHLPWSLDGIAGSRRFIEKVWKLTEKISDTDDHRDVYYKQLHKTIDKVQGDIENFAFNTAVSALMICVKSFEEAPALHKEDVDAFIRILAPFAPYIAEEIYHNHLEHTSSVHLAPWPSVDHDALIENMMTLPVQINGKVRGQITVPKDTPEDSIFSLASASHDVAHWIKDKDVIKKIYVPERIVNFVINDK